MDVVPVLYDKNWRTYIPARFVSEALDRKVVWDGGNRAVMISDEETYNEVFEILTKCEEANEVVYFEFNLKAESMDSSGSTVSMNMDMSMTYSDLNGNFDIEVPQDVLDAAVESVDVIEIDQ